MLVPVLDFHQVKWTQGLAESTILDKEGEGDVGILNLVREWALEGALEYYGEEERQRGQMLCGTTKVDQLSQVDTATRDK